MSTEWQGKNDASALGQIQRLARLNRIILTSHAIRRMNQRSVTERDVRWALLTATAAFRKDERSAWRIEGGVDIDDDDLTLVCALEDDVIVVTLF